MIETATHLNRMIVGAGLALLVAAGCASDPPEEMMAAPAAVGSAQPYLHVAEDGLLWMSWIEPADTAARALRYASYDGDRWSEPKTIAEGADLFANWADIPHLTTLPGGRMVADYPVHRGPAWHAYDLMVRQAGPNGAWNEPLRVHDDETRTEHGFASTVPTNEGVMMIWLDGRETGAAEGQSEGGSMMLYAALLDASGAIREAGPIDERVCDCCPTSAVRTESGALIAYRDRSEDETRDIHLIRFEEGRWTEPYPLHDDGWIIEGCPVNGPSLVAAGDRVAAAWFTAAQDAPMVKVAFSGDGGRTFGEPIVVDDAGPRGRAEALMLDDGATLVSWLGSEENAMALRVARVSSDAGVGVASTIVIPQSPAFVGRPQLARRGDDILLAWVDGPHKDSTEIRLARRSLEEFD